jgi:hypothetical protein
MALGCAFLGGLAVYWDKFPPRDPIGTANGVYSSDCCGSLILRDGFLRFDDTNVGYVVEHDKVGRYVLPDKHVGVIEGQRVVAGTQKYALKIYLHDTDGPRRLSMLGTDKSGQSRDYVFVAGPPKD